jgi:hypothetical protein
VGAREVGGNRIVAGKGADAGHLVRRQHHSQAGSANQDAGIRLASRHLPGHFLCVVGIIDAVQGVGAEVLHLDALVGKVLADLFFQLKTRVV